MKIIAGAFAVAVAMPTEQTLELLDAPASALGAILSLTAGSTSVASTTSIVPDTIKDAEYAITPPVSVRITVLSTDAGDPGIPSPARQ